VTTSLPFLDTIVLTVMGHLPPPAILTRGVLVSHQHKDLGMICVLMQRRFAALR
jgi:hypothetical protein